MVGCNKPPPKNLDFSLLLFPALLSSPESLMLLESVPVLEDLVAVSVHGDVIGTSSLMEIYLFAL